MGWDKLRIQERLREAAFPGKLLNYTGCSPIDQIHIGTWILSVGGLTVVRTGWRNAVIAASHVGESDVC